MNISVFNAYAAVLAGVCSVSFLYFGFYVRSPALKDPRFRPLMHLCFFSSAWSVAYMLYFLSTDEYMRDLCRRCCFAGMLAFAYLLWFLIRYSGIIKNRRWAGLISLAILLPPLAGAYKGIFENAVVRDFPSGFWFLYAEIQSTSYNVASIVLMLLYYRRRRTVMTRNYAYVLCASAAVLMAGSLAADFYFGFRDSQNIMPLWLLIWIGILMFAIKKYRFMPATSDLINRDITENIEEGIVLLDPELRTTFMNAPARRLLQIGDGEPPPFLDLVLERRVLDEEMLGLARGGLSFDSRVGLIPRGGGEKLPVDMHVKRLIDAYNETSGYLVIVSRVKDDAHLKSAYRITERELDVMHQLSVGKSNKEIAGILGISEKTIETHVASIYGKLMVKNRVELLKLLSGYASFGLAITPRQGTPDSPQSPLPRT